MSRQRDRISRVVEKLGVVIDELDWTPISRGSEKCGPAGGWILTTECGRLFLSYSTDGLIDIMTRELQEANYGSITDHLASLDCGDII